MTDRGLTIEIYSDVVCPWCYIGKRRLERALDQLNGAAQARITWRPFELNPTMPKEGMERTTYLESKFGSLDAFRQLEEHVLAAGAAERIPFAFGKVARTPNTFMAHRLIWYAEQQGRQDAVVESLFRGYFVEGADIGIAVNTRATGRSLRIERGGRGAISSEWRRDRGGQSRRSRRSSTRHSRGPLLRVEPDLRHLRCAASRRVCLGD